VISHRGHRPVNSGCVSKSSNCCKACPPLPGVAESIRRCNSLPLRVPTVLPVQRRGFLESRGKCRCLSLWDVRHRLSKDCARRGDSDGSAPAYAYALREFGHDGSVGFCSGFSFPKMGNVGAIANGLTVSIVAFGMASEADSWLYGESATPLCKAGAGICGQSSRHHSARMSQYAR
jgi:hypothetical protein